MECPWSLQSVFSSCQNRLGGIYCNGPDLRDLMLAGPNPNDKYLSWLGRWVARVSERFAGLPVPYQRLTEIAVTAIAFATAAILVFAP